MTQADPFLTRCSWLARFVAGALIAGCSVEGLEDQARRPASIEQAITASDDIILYGRSAVITSPGGKWRKESDTSAAAGIRLTNPDVGAAKAAAPSSTDYVELTFTPKAGKDYRLWIRAKATANSYDNDSIFVQFSNATDTSGKAIWRTGTSEALPWSLEEAQGSGLAGWGWQDTSVWTTTAPRPLGPRIRFDSSAPQKIRISARQDGLMLDQIVLSGSTYLSSAPGAERNDATILSPERNVDASTSTAATLNVVSFNVHKAYDAPMSSIVSFIASRQPDVVMLQEATKNIAPSTWETALESATGAAWYTHAGTDSHHLLLSRYPVTGWAMTVVSPNSSGGSRRVTHGQITVGGTPVHLFNTHLDWPNATYLQQGMDGLINVLATYSGRKIIGGDFNASPTSSQMAQLRNAGYVDVLPEAYGSTPVPPTHEAGWRPDAIYRSTGIRTESAVVVNVSLSDHFPVVARLSIQ
jgi:endonuclease/exonuclease/phosphatase (EEP) superfamily protein YafD